MLEVHSPAGACCWVPMTWNAHWSSSVQCLKDRQTHLQKVRESEEPGQNRHQNAIRLLPCIDRLNVGPLLVLDEAHERVDVSRACIASELSLFHMINRRQSGDKESSRQSGIIAKWHMRCLYNKVITNVRFKTMKFRKLTQCWLSQCSQTDRYSTSQSLSMSARDCGMPGTMVQSWT